MAIYQGDCLVTHCFMSILENGHLIHSPVNALILQNNSVHPPNPKLIP